MPPTGGHWSPWPCARARPAAALAQRRRPARVRLEPVGASCGHSRMTRGLHSARLGSSVLSSPNLASRSCAWVCVCVGGQTMVHRWPLSRMCVRRQWQLAGTQHCTQYSNSSPAAEAHAWFCKPTNKLRRRRRQCSLARTRDAAAAVSKNATLRRPGQGGSGVDAVSCPIPACSAVPANEPLPLIGV